MGAYDDQDLQAKDERKRKKTGSSRAERVSFAFFDYNLTKDERELIVEDTREWWVLFAEITTMNLAGYKWSISYKVEEAHWLLTVAGNSKDCENYGMILTARASSWEQVIKVAWWKLEFVNWDSKWKSSIGEGTFFD